MKGGGILCVLLLASCQKQATPEKPRMASVAELAALMKNEINPSFSRIMFLLFHGDGVEQDGKALQAELQRSAATLRTSITRLRAWPKVPAESEEARTVFYTFAESVDGQTGKLLAAIERADRATAMRQLEQIADTCNNCHHFFRLNIEDSKVGPQQAAALVQVDKTGSQ